MHSKPAAAVAIIRVDQPIDSFLLLRRNTHPEDPWSGHFSFPGGRRDSGDSTILDTCFRETLEETGIFLNQKHYRGALPPSLAGSRTNSPILVQPYLFHLDTRPQLTIDHSEISSYCWLETQAFLDNSRHVEAEVLPNHYFPAFPLDDYYLWGFTYKLLQGLLHDETSEYA